MNPDTFTGRSDEEILSTLAHEMAHVWQQTHGTPPRRSYHDRQWAAKMKEIGLQPTTTGAAGRQGNRPERHALHHRRAALTRRPTRSSRRRGFQLHWQSAPAGQQAKAKKASKTKFTCPDCGQNAWAKPDALLICGDLLRGRRRRNLPDAGRAERRKPKPPDRPTRTGEAASGRTLRCSPWTTTPHTFCRTAGRRHSIRAAAKSLTGANFKLTCATWRVTVRDDTDNPPQGTKAAL